MKECAVSIGNRIKQRRIQLEMSQQDLADILRTTQQQIYRYEAGKNNPTSDVIIAVAKALDTSTDWLLGLTDDVKPFQGESDLTDMEREMINIMRRKSPDQQRQLVDVARVI